MLCSLLLLTEFSVRCILREMIPNGYDFEGRLHVQFTQATDYGFRVVLYVAGILPGEVVSAQEIAVSQRIPQRFLQKVMRPLTRAGIVCSKRGVAGGYALSRAADEITLYDVVLAMEGSVVLNRCLNETAVCTLRVKTACPVHQALSGVQEQFVLSLRAVSFAQLLQQVREERKEESIEPFERGDKGK